MEINYVLVAPGGLTPSANQTPLAAPPSSCAFVSRLGFAQEAENRENRK
jgi:hypothetical protein